MFVPSTFGASFQCRLAEGTVNHSKAWHDMEPRAVSASEGLGQAGAHSPSKDRLGLVKKWSTIRLFVMASPLLSNKTFITLGGLFFAVWIVAPLLLIVVFAAMNRSGGDIRLLTGFLLMVSLAGVVFGGAFALAIYFKKIWLLATPLLYILGSSIYGAFFGTSGTQTTVFVTPDSPAANPAAQAVNSPGASLEQVLHFTYPGMSKDNADAVAGFVESRQAKLAEHILKDRGFCNQALVAASLVTNPSPAVITAVQSAGDSLTQRLKRFNELNIRSDCTSVAPALFERFRAWHLAAIALQERGGPSAKAQLATLQQLAEVRGKECPAIGEILRTLSPRFPGRSP